METSGADYRQEYNLSAFFPVRELQYTPEELLGMMLNYSRGLAQDFAGQFSLLQWIQSITVQYDMKCIHLSFFVTPPDLKLTEQPIKDAVITVPAFFNQAERRAILQAAQMAGLKVLQLINDNAAVALNYGVFRRKDIDNTVKVQSQRYSQIKHCRGRVFFS